MADYLFDEYKSSRPSITLENSYNENSTPSISDNIYLMSFLKELEGYKTKLKEFHWATSGILHIRIDEFLSEVSDFQDAVAEDGQATFGRIKLGTFDSTPCIVLCIKELMNKIKFSLIDIRNNYSSNPDYIGIVNEIEGFFHILKKYTYLINNILEDTSK